jgi:hypothetical protein
MSGFINEKHNLVQIGKRFPHFTGRGEVQFTLTKLVCQWRDAVQPHRTARYRKLQVALPLPVVFAITARRKN